MTYEHLHEVINATETIFEMTSCDIITCI